jgi:hypothetical protein
MAWAFAPLVLCTTRSSSAADLAGGIPKHQRLPDARARLQGGAISPVRRRSAIRPAARARGRVARAAGDVGRRAERLRVSDRDRRETVGEQRAEPAPVERGREGERNVGDGRPSAAAGAADAALAAPHVHLDSARARRRGSLRHGAGRARRPEGHARDLCPRDAALGWGSGNGSEP